MPRYMQQDLFDLIVVTALTLETMPDAKARAKQLEELVTVVAGYVASYDGETKQSMVRDIGSAVQRTRPVIQSVSERLSAPMFSVLRAMQKQLEDDTRSSRPLLKKIFGGTAFNYEKAPLPDRVGQCQKDIFKAGARLLAKHFGVLLK